MNAVNVVGRLTKDPEPRKTQNGSTLLMFCVAVSRGDKNKSTDFIDCQAWGSKAEFISQYFRKGSPIALSGSLQTRTYDDKNGISKKVTEIVVKEVFFVPSSGGNSDNTQNMQDAGELDF